MISTIQLSNKIKETLATYKTTPRQSYEEVIVNLIFEIENRKKIDEKLLIEGYKEMAEFDLKLCNELSGVDADGDSEWVWEE